MSEQEIKVGSEWKWRGNSIAVVISDPMLWQDQRYYPLVWKGATGIPFLMPEDVLRRDYTPHIREPKVGEVWQWKDDGREFEIVHGPRSYGDCGSVEFVKWDSDVGYCSFSIDLILRQAEYVRQGPL